jgi:GDPmannose 4,6-dehydratase
LLLSKGYVVPEFDERLGHARDYVEGMWLTMQQEEPDDYVLATGEAHSVREFVEKAFAHVGRKILRKSEGIEDKGIDRGSRKVLRRDRSTIFPPDGGRLLMAMRKAHNKLGWHHRV